MGLYVKIFYLNIKLIFKLKSLKTGKPVRLKMKTACLTMYKR